MLTTLWMTMVGCSGGGAERAAPTAPEPETEAPAEPAAPEAPPFPEDGVVAGVIDAPVEVPAAKALFVQVRVPGARVPLAVRRYPPGPFPIAFLLRETDRPRIPGPEIPEALELRATLDLDGDVATPDDQNLELVVDVARGAQDLELSLPAPQAAE